MNRIEDNLICFEDNARIVRAFVSHSVEFTVVGGLAVSWYCDSRQADDMDLLVNPTRANSENVYIALSKLHLNLMGLARDAFAAYGVQLPLKGQYYADILTPAKNGLTFEEINSQSIAGKLFNFPVRIPSIAHLIKLKEHAATSEKTKLEKHLKDIEFLEELDL